MANYLLKRLIFIFPTLFVIILVNFTIVQFAPGGPVERLVNELSHPISVAKNDGVFAGSASLVSESGVNIDNIKYSGTKYKGSQGIDPEIIAKIEKAYGFDQPFWVRFWQMLKKYLVFDLGESFYQDKKVSELIVEKLPVSISLGIWTTLIIYLVCIPLGIKKAVKSGSKFDIYSSFIVVIGYAIPSFIFAILLITLFCGGNFWQIFPLQGLVSDNFSELSFGAKILDYLWHIFLPVLCMVIGGFASLTFLCKNSFLEEINKQYVIAAKARGLSEKQVLYGHVFRNASLIIIAGLPATLIGILFTSGVLIEVVFSLDGLGLLGFEAAISRDYPVIFGTLYIFTLIGLVTNILSDLTYHLIDPRINFASHS